jgi:hypothetical protein
MASALIQSNAQSALISTLNAASEASVNPFEYTLTKRIPSHGVQWTRLQAVNSGHTKPGDVLNFDLIKMGFTRSLTFQCEVHMAALGTMLSLCTPGTGWLNLIDRADIESSSRRILSLTKGSMMAAYSDLNYEQRQAFSRGCRMHAHAKSQYAANKAANKDDPLTIYIPLLFSVFDNAALALATGFSEPIRVSIKFAGSFDFVHKFVGQAAADGEGSVVNAVAKIGSNIGVNNAVLVVEHRLLPNELEDATIAANYSQGPLSQLVYDYEEESQETAPYTTDTEVVIKHEIKSTAVATDIYVYCEVKMPEYSTLVNTDATGAAKLESVLRPIPIDKISFTASGQNIADHLDAQYIGCFGKRTLKDGFFGSSGGGGFEMPAQDLGTNQVYEPANPCFVYRLQFGLDSSKQYDSNGISLRELNAPTITVTLPKTTNVYGRKVNEHHAGKVVTMHTIIRKLGLQTTDSSSGRMVSTLSN